MFTRTAFDQCAAGSASLFQIRQGRNSSNLIDCPGISLGLSFPKTFTFHIPCELTQINNNFGMSPARSGQLLSSAQELPVIRRD